MYFDPISRIIVTILCIAGVGLGIIGIIETAKALLDWEHRGDNMKPEDTVKHLETIK